MTQPSPEPFHFDPPEGSDASETPDLLGRRSGLVAVLVTDQAHESGWASRAAVALAEAALASGNTVGLVDFSLDEPRLQAAAGTEGKEGLADIVLFGASVDRVSGWSPGGARVIGAGTPVDSDLEAETPAPWLDAVRLAQDGGCVLAYVRAGSSFGDAVANGAEDVIVLRHAGEEATGWSGTPSLVLEPSPVGDEVEEPTAAAMPAPPAVDDDVEISLDDDPAEEAPTVHVSGVLDDAALDGGALDDGAFDDGALDDGALDDGVAATAALTAAAALSTPSDAVEAAAVEETPRSPASVTDSTDEGEVSVDLDDVGLDDRDVDDVGSDDVELDDVVGDVEGDGGSMFAPPSPAAETADVDAATADVAGLEVEPEWPDFEQPLVVHEPGEVDPLVAAGSGATIGDSVDPDALDDILGEGTEVNIVSDDLGTGTPVAFDEEVTSEVLDGLVNPSMQSLSPAGGEDLASAERVSGLGEPPAWDGLPGADDLGVRDQPIETADPPGASDAAGVVDEPLDAPVDGSWVDGSSVADAGTGAGPHDFGGDGEQSIDLDGPTEPAEEAMRLDDPWGEPDHVAPAAEVQPAAEALEGFDEAFAEQLADPLPWESGETAPAPAAAPEPDVPVANVTRTRTRTRTKGPRPFLLILILLLIATVAVLQWVGLLDVAGLGFLREGGP